ncbi:amino acid adenylation domain-containing protein [Streptomyces sp. OE57]|uniref:non-ribosomal peptide synthetase n=1 Tax=Streptomyces lacaronensis TaxID=3379885 RepID=UPI0039B759FF
MTDSALVGVWPLSPLQEGLLFHAVYDEEGIDVYVEQMITGLEGKLDSAVLRASWQALLDRHESLRAGFQRRASGAPVQLVMRRVTLPWREEDLSGLDADTARAESERLGIEERERRFDLAVPPLLKVLLVRVGPDEYRMMVTLHHILLDGWSLPVLMRELWTCYEAGGSAHGLPPVTPYREYLAWLARQNKEEAMAAWRKTLAGADEPTLVAPAEYNGAPAHSAMVSGRASEELDQALRDLTRRLHGLTLNTVVQVAWALVVGKLTGRRDVVFGASVAGRPLDLPGMESMLGLFINTVPVRVRFDPAQSVAQLLAELRAEQAALVDYQYLSLSDIQRQAGPGATFDTIMAFESFPSGTNARKPPGDKPSGDKPSGDEVERRGPGGLKFTEHGLRESINYPLGLVVGPSGGLGMRLSYRPDLFDEETAQGLVDQVLRVLGQMAADPETLVGRLDVLGEVERARVVEEWNATGAAVSGGSVVERFEAWVGVAPDVVAVRCGGEALSYGELDERANRLARLLCGVGVGRESRVALCLARSVDMVVAELAVWKAGGAFVPLDPEYPADRLGFVIADSGAEVVLGTVDCLDGVPLGDARAVLLEGADAFSAEPLGTVIVPEQLAYVIYTSGSTGRPKGVAVAHGGVVNLAEAMRPVLGMDAGVVALQFASFSFDAAVLDVVVTLAAGGTLAVASAEERKDPRALAEMIGRCGARVASVVPSLLGVLDPDAVPGVGNWVLGAERLSAELAGRWSAGARVWNTYGPTEATVITTATATALKTGLEAAPPIGRPLPNNKVFVLDPFLRPVSVGVIGEVYVAGAGLARGYIGRPGLSAERFVACPFAAPGGRMYRSGDLAKWTEEGDLVFAGRVDEQVKVRGFRVEPGEIEAVVAAFEGVGQVAVVVREDGPGDKQLVAYVVPNGELDVAGVREFAAGRLPEYMVPTVVVLDALPLTVNGKLDRAKLPAPDATATVAGRGPATPNEEILCGLFAEVLGVERVSADASFFELGGDSLLAMRLIARLRAVLDTRITIRELFTATTVALLSRRIEEEGNADGRARPALLPCPRTDAVPLSYAQRRMWFLNRLEGVGEGAGYNLPLALRLSGELDRGALEAALGDVADRHESLRTVFPETDGEPRQHVLTGGAGRPSLVVVETVEQELPQTLMAHSARGFDLSVDLPWRARLLKTGPSEFVLLIVAHHIAVDGWSMGVLGREIGVAYGARRAGRAPGWEPLPVQYADYALWQREVLGDLEDPGSVISGQLGYWREALDGAPEELILPVDRSRPVVSSFRGRSVPVRVSPQVHARLVALAQRGRATMFMVVQAALALLLSRMGAGKDIPVGTAVAGRGDAALDGLVGFFVNTLVLRSDVSGDPSFVELLSRVREADLDAYAHQDVPFERLVEDLNPARSLGRNPLFQVSLGLQGAPAGEGRLWDLPGLRVRPLESGAEASARVDLALDLAEHRDGDGNPGGIDGAFLYATDLFDEQTVEVLAERLVRVLEQIASDPAARVSEVAVLGSGERARVLEEWNATERDVPVRPLAELFDERVELSPDAVAVVGAGGEEWSYAQLRERSERVAGVLGARGVGRGDLVAVVLERSVDVVAVLLGIAKAGAGFVPVDPAYPVERIGWMVEDSAPALVLCSERTRRLVPAGVECLVWDPSDPLAEPAPAVSVDVDDVAYVIYTSGSTGRPKGVAVTHRGIGNLVGAQIERFGVGADARVLQLASLSFDASVWELFMALLSGAALVMADPDRLPPHGSLSEVAAEFGVTHVTVSPSVLATVEELPESLGTVVVASEVCPPGLVERWASGRRMVNAYGPTEVTVCATVSEPLEASGSGPVPIGRPITNTRAFVLDECLHPVPVGVLGELYVAGPGLARGYLGRAGLTAERFVACPFTGGRMYRTGDLVKWTADGQLVFGGRVDDQVKVRGFRVEPGEIETVLAAHPGVGQVAVIAREDRAGDKRLVAYVVSDDAVDVSQLRTFLAGRLPDYMVPAVFVTLGALPITVNGKLDRSALPAPDFTGAATAGRGPQTPTEERLCMLFAEVLGLEEVGAEASFFELGGDSILVMKLIAQIRAVLGAEVSIRALFTAPTVADVARLLDATEDSTAQQALTARPRPEVLPLSYAQQRMWFLNRLEGVGDGAVYNLPLALRLSGELDGVALEAALGDVADRHESLRTVFPETDGEPRQHVLTGEAGRPPLIVVETAEEHLREVLGGYAARGFDLSVDLPWRARLLKTGPSEFVLLIVAHHIAVDGWSMGVLGREIGVAYGARRAGRAPGWEPLPVQYADYALWQREVLGDLEDPESVISGQLGYWREALAGAPEELILPTDRPRPAVSSFRGGEVPVAITAETHAQLTGLAQRGGATMFMVMHAAISALLSRMGAGKDIPVGTAVAGRGDAALDGLVGFFVNTLVLRSDVSGDPSFVELLSRVREADLDAYAHQDVPFERLVEDLNPARSLGRNPLFQVSLGLQGAPGGEGRLWDLPGLGVRPLESGAEASARVDLALDLAEHRDDDGNPGGIRGAFLYATDLFDERTVEVLAERLVRSLEQVAADPSVRVSEFEVLGGAERARVLGGWNATERDVPVRPLAELFDERVELSPDAVAVVGAGGEEWSYAGLRERSERVAGVLGARGVGRGDLVAVVLERSVDVVAVLLGIAKAGAGFVPVDPAYPVERIGWMVEDSAPALVLCSEGTRGLVPAGVECLMWDPSAVQSADAPPAPVVSVSVDDVAYVIYTSGSTGRPKGVAVTHRGIGNLVGAQIERFAVGADARVLQLASLSFDASVWELFMALLSGAALVMADPDRLPPHGSLSEVAAEFGVTHVTVSPSVLATVEELPGSLGTVVVASEVCPPGLVERWASGRRMVNAYGPTEVTVCATVSEPLEASGSGPVPIGRPITNTRAFVLDERLHPVPVGALGELYVAGPGLARGYLGRAGLTAERFVACPFTGGRMYRTGDLVKWTADGQLVFGGRVDDQVKVRGFRVEPGEVETVLAAHPGVGQVAVIAREDRAGDKRLVAYVVSDDAVDVSQLRTFLAGRLPDYMVPAVFVTLGALPITVNGKLDRSALPAPDFTGAATAGRGPQTPTEERLCMLFAEVLGLEEVGAEASFFELGGDSILVMKLIAQIRAVLGAEVSIRALFTAPTVADVARLLDATEDGTARTDSDGTGLLLPLRTEGGRPPVFCVHPSTGLGRCYAELTDHLPPDRPVYALQARGFGTDESLPRTVEEMAADYVARIRTVQPAGPYHLLGWSFGGTVAHAMAALLQQRGETVDLLASLDGYPGVDEAEPTGAPDAPHEPDAPADEPDAPADEPGEGPRGGRRKRVRMLSEIQRVNANNNRLLQHHTPGVFRGDLLLFVATEGRPASAPAPLAPDSWAPYVDGHVEPVRIASDHDGMLTGEPLETIGRLISAQLLTKN